MYGAPGHTIEQWKWAAVFSFLSPKNIDEISLQEIPRVYLSQSPRQRVTYYGNNNSAIKLIETNKNTDFNY